MSSVFEYCVCVCVCVCVRACVDSGWVIIPCLMQKLTGCSAGIGIIDAVVRQDTLKVCRPNHYPPARQWESADDNYARNM